MQRNTRDTARWFDNDHKASLGDKEVAPGVGPGKYQVAESFRHANSKQQTSWNMGSVPFGSGDQRFRKNYRQYFQPGPDKYNPKAITAPEISE